MRQRHWARIKDDVPLLGPMDKSRLTFNLLLKVQWRAMHSAHRMHACAWVRAACCGNADGRGMGSGCSRAWGPAGKACL